MNERELLLSGLAQLGLHSPEARAVDQLMDFCARLLEKNQVMNLTAVTDPGEVVTRHFLDCAALVPYAAGRVVDIGTGAGFPGIPLAVLTDAEVLLLDAMQKRVGWLREVIGALALPNAEAVQARAEEFGHREVFDLAVSRAVARLNVLAELSLPMVRQGGRFIAMKAEQVSEEVAEASHAIAELGGELEEVRVYRVPHTERRHSLVILRKVRETPERYPRRFAKITAHPL